jgi:hypothetical protein
VIVADDRAARFVSDALGVGFCPPWTAMGIERDGVIVAGALFNVFEGADVHVSVAGKGWTRAFLRAVGVYVFGTLGCGRMTFVTENETVARLAQRLGGQLEGRMRSHFGPGRDAILIGVLRDEWRYGVQDTNLRSISTRARVQPID